FFQAEDGIRDLIVTGVQTCALPISATKGAASRDRRVSIFVLSICIAALLKRYLIVTRRIFGHRLVSIWSRVVWNMQVTPVDSRRSEERRVGKECMSRCGREP